jgi:hypothetical protein
VALLALVVVLAQHQANTVPLPEVFPPPVTVRSPEFLAERVFRQPVPPVPKAQWTPPLLHTATMFTLVRAAEAYLWPHPFAETDPEVLGRYYKDTFTKPPIFDSKKPAFRWDGDPLVINIVGHGLMGSELYLRSRQCAFGWAGSLAFAAGSSVIWEYIFEGNGVRPSVQDMVYTPLMGLALGEFRYQLWRWGKRMKSPGGKFLQGVVDPFGELERGVLGSGC